MFYSGRLRHLYIGEKGPGCCLLSISLLLVIIMTGCSGEKTTPSVYDGSELPEQQSSKIFPGDLGFDIKPKYSYIRSYPGGGGIFVVKLETNAGFVGDVKLSMAADPALNARLDKRVLSPNSDVAEITIRPDDSIAIGTYGIELKAVHAMNPSGVERFRTVFLEVEVFQWGPGNPANVLPKMDEFISWLETEHPELGNFSDRVWFPYITYPEILIVEHWTFLDEDWEFRLCYHVTIPPYDWSKILLRRRGQWDPVLAAMRESDGTIYEIPISDYPIMFGY